MTLTTIIAALAARLGIGRGLAGLLLAGVALIAVSGALWGVYAVIRHEGAEDARTEIERKDHEAGQAASEARDRLRRCFERGGLPDPKTGKCDR